MILELRDCDDSPFACDVEPLIIIIALDFGWINLERLALEHRLSMNFLKYRGPFVDLSYVTMSILAEDTAVDMDLAICTAQPRQSL